MPGKFKKLRKNVKALKYSVVCEYPLYGIIHYLYIVKSTKNTKYKDSASKRKINKYQFEKC